jgi:hypothetical protein
MAQRPSFAIRVRMVCRLVKIYGKYEQGPYLFSCASPRHCLRCSAVAAPAPTARSHSKHRLRPEMAKRPMPGGYPAGAGAKNPDHFAAQIDLQCQLPIPARRKTESGLTLVPRYQFPGSLGSA